MKKQDNSYLRITMLLILLFTGLSNSNAQSQNIEIKMTHKDIKTEEGLEASLQRLITPDKDFGRDDLQEIYHEDMNVIIIDDKGSKNEFRKPTFMDLIGGKIDNREEHKSNNWAKFHHINIEGDNGHVIVERKLNLTGTKTKLLVNIDFIWQDERWQITREVIYSQEIN